MGRNKEGASNSQIAICEQEGGERVSRVRGWRTATRRRLLHSGFNNRRIRFLIAAPVQMDDRRLLPSEIDRPAFPVVLRNLFFLLLLLLRGGGTGAGARARRGVCTVREALRVHDLQARVVLEADGAA